MRPTRPTIKITNPLKSWTGRYALLLIGLGAAGVMIGWAGPDALMRRR
ncbi:MULTISPECIES: hypothetical protein [Thermomonospora]|uniref:Uncharacterized protein n=1 Tax=Thermomonospora curvata (strain ATCC 19995 / DSM 43183 / JCM 3096 / KCTC 9072 / NBRC 15933 / NCIMB 10081 / Henssen B9) TaxID=471852 RepID=D1A1X1_THECD|nr:MULTISPECIES: hypothetical protein [Thermomonospora]ACY97809.1 hypothetical protein Tcur_2243 [Thermomonospora curvata DSM 43183]